VLRFASCFGHFFRLNELQELLEDDHVLALIKAHPMNRPPIAAPAAAAKATFPSHGARQGHHHRRASSRIGTQSGSAAVAAAAAAPAWRPHRHLQKKFVTELRRPHGHGKRGGGGGFGGSSALECKLAFEWCWLTPPALRPLPIGNGGLSGGPGGGGGPPPPFLSPAVALDLASGDLGDPAVGRTDVVPAPALLLAALLNLEQLGILRALKLGDWHRDGAASPAAEAALAPSLAFTFASGFMHAILQDGLLSEHRDKIHKRCEK
jgi:hypothetical protein